MIGYPDQLPTDAIQNIVSIVMGGNILAKKDEFALSAWNLQGYFQKVLIPASTTSVSALSASNTLDDEEAVEALNHLKALLDKGDEAPVIAAAIPVPVIIILQWLLTTLLNTLAK